jgi:hypothetical protein
MAGKMLPSVRPRSDHRSPAEAQDDPCLYDERCEQGVET